EIFVPCAPDITPPAPGALTAPPPVSAARLDRAGYTDWATALSFVLDLLGRPGAANRRDIMVLAGLPLPASGPVAVSGRVERWPLALFDEPDMPQTGASIADPVWLGSGRLMLGYPWVRTTLSAALPEAVEGPDGVLAGLIARGALLSGAFASVGGQLL